MNNYIKIQDKIKGEILKNLLETFFQRLGYFFNVGYELDECLKGMKGIMESIRIGRMYLTSI